MRERPTLIIDQDNAGRRLDAFVRQLFLDVPLGAVMKWLRKGVVRVNGKRQEPNYRLQAGDVLSLPEARGGAVQDSPKLTPQAAGLVIVFEDDDLLVLNKPAGLPSQPGSGHDDSLVARVVRYLGRENAPPGKKPGLVQRLDKDVSGLVPAGKNAPALKTLNEWVDAGTADKEYWALVDGVVPHESASIEQPLRVLEQAAKDAPKVVVDTQGLSAFTSYQVLQRFAQATLLSVRIKTGRMHQIRAHLRSVGHPIAGDPRYNAGGKTLGAPSLFLHARRLQLPHPRTGEIMMFEAELPQPLQQVLQRLKDSR